MSTRFNVTTRPHGYPISARDPLPLAEVRAMVESLFPRAHLVPVHHSGGYIVVTEDARAVLDVIPD